MIGKLGKFMNKDKCTGVPNKAEKDVVHLNYEMPFHGLFSSTKIRHSFKIRAVEFRDCMVEVGE